MYYWNKYKNILLLTLLVFMFFILSGIAWAAEEEVAKNYGFLSLLPPLVAITLCFITKQVLASLFIGIWVGATILIGWNPLSGVTKTLGYIVGNAADSWNATILLFDFVVGGLIGLICLSGGAQAFVKSVTNKVKTSRGGQVTAWLFGLIIFFDDYANSAIVGNAFRAVSDKLRMSREKLSFIVDATSAPVASIALISTWIGYQVGLIGDAIEGTSVTMTPYSIFLHSIPYSFYSIFALILVLAIALSGRDYGPMLKAEYRTRTTGKVFADGATPLSGGSQLRMLENVPQKTMNMVVPLVALVGISMFGMWWTGGGTSAESFIAAISDADAMTALLWGAFFAVIIAIIMYKAQGIGTLADMMDAFIDGAKMMVLANLILLSAWSIGDVCSEIGTAPYVVNAAKGVISPLLLPMVMFLICNLISFATGTSWGTMAIAVPIAIPLALALGVPLPLAISAILTGSVMGDHCSPISDTTIMSSMFSGSDHMDHVKTQIPYAFTASGVAVLAYLAAGSGISVGLILPLGIILVGILLYLFSSISAKSAGISFPLPEPKIEEVKEV
ncbi:MAG: sodium:proton antiporter [Candidatus Infernicultor aquiphilus]|uniref:Sodium:proton antiporter n=1 Tax=Candidatus Infernicultor aquiphilus TaxID=1805029 RepID=A0A1J5GRB6_9BACT|nr:MAG: sodium:proton antiporter [Candidatus Atribacteria bacterium CG2_30_33_13]PIU24927.1 MAG: sodium:proton antiporter [Candidatus Atribacteria bacterium CG08_land_8_20_14_0_20_33_29]PIW11880.1 MAG: sodium:proton antiporter [Candidatus Atribacteria bacterium CG17_big_fil_post_rev_8_21_14_2_50_34_11]PIX35024.1 MAG: sodium:proton antiporter [Candidatus Atribacteria bacterium CG_4_8_14_3_um_filter_34_18]PIY32132.1 MAG: sodium:proton antiporter [Candidatus Atribacteria bacterium CG_4_10_14_3_um_